MKIKKEKEVVEVMIRLYCKHREGNKDLCPNCQQLLDYANSRLSKCKFGDEKFACKKCPIHCYKPEQREQIRKVMKYSGPRMFFYHPLMAFRHLIGR
jgi:hypothetical protein